MSALHPWLAGSSGTPSRRWFRFLFFFWKTQKWCNNRKWLNDEKTQINIRKINLLRRNQPYLKNHKEDFQSFPSMNHPLLVFSAWKRKLQKYSEDNSTIQKIIECIIIAFLLKIWKNQIIIFWKKLSIDFHIFSIQKNSTWLWLVNLPLFYSKGCFTFNSKRNLKDSEVHHPQLLVFSL
jgi:hypothetical protein